MVPEKLGFKKLPGCRAHTFLSELNLGVRTLWFLICGAHGGRASTCSKTLIPLAHIFPADGCPFCLPFSHSSEGMGDPWEGWQGEGRRVHHSAAKGAKDTHQEWKEPVFPDHFPLERFKAPYNHCHFISRKILVTWVSIVVRLFSTWRNCSIRGRAKVSPDRAKESTQVSRSPASA